MHMDYLLYELKFFFFFQRMENINEPSPNVGISTGKSDEVNNDSMVYPSTLKIFQEIKKKQHSGICHG